MLNRVSIEEQLIAVIEDHSDVHEDAIKTLTKEAKALKLRVSHLASYSFRLSGL